LVKTSYHFYLRLEVLMAVRISHCTVYWMANNTNVSEDVAVSSQLLVPAERDSKSLWSLGIFFDVNTSIRKGHQEFFGTKLCKVSSICLATGPYVKWSANKGV
jgi:hypothetical protein